MKKILHTGQIVIVMACIFYTLFYKLGQLPYRIWDESRLATNAWEMSKGGNVLVPTLDGKADMWNTKPPLMIWAQALCIKMHGLTEFSVRLPAVLSACVTVLIVVLFTFYITGNSWCAIFSGIVLCTSRGYIGYHGARFGEYDSMVTLFTTGYLILFFMYTNGPEKHRNKYLLGFFALLAAAVLSKSVAGLLFVPGLFIYLLIKKLLTGILTNKYFYIGVTGVLCVVIGYYLLREHFNPGYLKAVYENELGGRFNSLNETHTGAWNFYLQNLWKERLAGWIWIFPALIILPFFIGAGKLRDAMIFLTFPAVLFLAIISASKTKLPWYDLPLFPLFAMLAALMFFQIGFLPARKMRVNANYIFPIVLTAVTLWPAYQTYNFIKWQNDDLGSDNFYAISYFLRDGLNGKRDCNSVIYLYKDYTPQSRLYLKRMKDVGIKMRERDYYLNNKFSAGDRVIVGEEAVGNYIENAYDYALLESFYNVKYYLIKSAK
jgi:4-amino-4-deoxy-L-arabinose transferase-like glycosyltransferase